MLVVAPLSILGVWEDEFAKFADFNYELKVLRGKSAEQKANTLWQMHGAALQVAVINYESARLLKKQIITWNPDLVIADEGHKIKTPGTKVSRAMYEIGNKVACYKLVDILIIIMVSVLCGLDQL